MSDLHGDHAIRSEFASDPDMVELIEMFAEELPERVAAIESAIRDEAWEDLGRIAHQLKGAGAGYGFQVISETASEVETSVKGLADCGETLEAIRTDVEALLDVCRRVVV